MSVASEPKKLTPDDLLAMPDATRFELVDGHLVERNVSALSSLVAGQFAFVLKGFCDPSKIAWVFLPDCGYRCFPDAPGKVRKPDVSCILRSRLPFERLSDGYVEIAPDLVVEVLSPNDLAYEVEEKVREYLDAGVRLVWVAIPPTRSVRAHRADGSVSEFHEDDDLTGEDVLPDFRCRVNDLFPGSEGSAATI